MHGKNYVAQPMHDDNATIRVTKMRVNFVDTIT